MSFSLVTAYPFWFLLLCVLLGGIYALILYYKNTNNGFSRRLNLTLAGIRLISVTLISFLLLSPLIRSVVRHSEKPVVILAVDNSESVRVGMDSAYLKNEFLPSLLNISDELREKFEVIPFLFSDKVEPGLDADFEGKQTDMGNLFSEIRTRYANRNVAALVLASDGINTRGSDPVYLAEKESYSIFTVALGDTSQQKDVLIRKVNYNQVVYLGNTFPIEITATGHKCSGETSKLSVISSDATVFSQDLRFQTGSASLTVPVTFRADKAGVQRYRIMLQSVKGEVSTANNIRDIFIEVLDGKQKILILSTAPHPDIAALRSSIERNRNYEVQVQNLNEFNGDINTFNLAILYQIPSQNDAGSMLLPRLREKQIPVMFVLGEQSNLNAYNSLQAGLNIPLSNAKYSSSFPLLNPEFSLFSIPPDVESIMADFPPLTAPFGQYKTSPLSETLLFQQIGSVQTQIPLVVFNNTMDQKTATIAGEGIWRWRLNNFQKAGNHDAFDELMSKMIQYLAIKTDKSPFRIQIRNYFNENDAVEVDAELYNESFELVNSPEVSFMIRNKEGKTFPYTFSRTTSAYYLNAGSFPPGEYSFDATVSYGGKKFSKSGNFIIVAVNEETLNTVANHNLLSILANQHKGQILPHDQVDKLIELLGKREDFKTVSYIQKRYTDLVNVPWFLFLLLTLLSMEWFMRKRSGGY